MTPRKSYYEVLGVTKEATLPEIRKGYRTALLASHPDKKFTSSGSGQLQSDISVIQDAYKVLSDSEMRLEYDNDLQSVLELNHKIELLGEALEVMTLDEFEEVEINGEIEWCKDCPRCTQKHSFVLSGDHLEAGMSYNNQNDEDLSYEIVIQCSSCSLWLKVKYYDLEGEDGEEL
ncbi:unnamed protein product [Kuraishia capsulata CBS 1993]|uniref:Diphthamide biosynthesis protein 4 n=1 Tax=Kuraishia capsulata CBS 1993 TaxID=1382522 RepID=W6MS67_9ASCO|nr:uncharacterized protein KUCA_T00004033001 [Kuraishia capsulata CBS 1993]CDK28052.1 unnamed protein product [Kuraishia capsulata CBS 1993]